MGSLAGLDRAGKCDSEQAGSAPLSALCRPLAPPRPPPGGTVTRPPTAPTSAVEAPASPAIWDRPDRRTPPREANRAVAGAPLENNTSRVSTPAQTDRQLASRQLRYQLRAGVQKYTGSKRVQKCGWCRIGPHVEVRLAGARAHYAGVLSCGSVWLCPVCAAKIAARRATEVSTILGRHFADGGGVAMATVTLPHHAGDRLARTRALASGAWQKVLQGRGWLRLQRQFGISGYIRALEVTHGKNGWHPHLHALILTDRPLEGWQLDAVKAHVFGAWRRAVVKAGHAAPEPHCTTVKPITDAGIAEYTSKLDAALEVTHGATKTARTDGGRTAFGILADFLAHGDADDLALWQEWETAMHGARQLTWSKGLKTRYAVEERTDEEVAADADLTGDTVAVLTPNEWRMIAARPLLQVRVLEAAEQGGAVGLDAFLSALFAPPRPDPAGSDTG
jgi:hypothetical protein